MKTVYKDDKIEFVKEEPVRSKSWEEFCENHPTVDDEWYIDFSSRITKDSFAFRNLEVDKNHLATKEDVEAALAQIQLTRLHDEWVGNWTPDWEDVSSKYAIEYCRNKFEIAELHHTSRFLVFPTEEMAKEFLNCPDIKQLIETAKRFI